MEKFLNISGTSVFKISLTGVLINTKTGRILRSNKANGYFCFRFKRNGKQTTSYVHRIFAEMFIPNPLNKPNVNHKNGIKTDNRIENLEWCTQQENIQHSWKTGLSKPHICGINKKGVVVNGSEYESLVSAAKYLGTQPAFLSKIARNKCTSKKYSAYFLE